MEKDIQAWFKAASDVQNACNLSGVVSSYREFLSACIERGMHNKERDLHPVSIAFAFKVADMARINPEYTEQIDQAFEQIDRVNAGVAEASWQ
jgi:hypothetical protein